MGSQVREWAKNSTCFSALPAIGRSDQLFLQLLWIASFCGGLGYCSYLLNKNFADYFSYDVSTQLSINRQASIEFPTITLCNMNPFKSESSIMKELEAYANESLAGLDNSLSIISSIQYMYQYDIKTLVANESFKQSLSYNIDDMLVNCRFDKLACLSSDFAHFYTPGFGNCYKFNSGVLANKTKTNIKKISSPGRRNALQLELFTGYMSPTHDLVYSYGFQVFIHNASSLPPIGTQAISLPVGYETDLVIKQTNLIKQPSPYSDCIDDVNSIKSFDSDCYRSTFNLVGKYDQSMCVRLCQQNYIIQSCQCYHVSFPVYNYSIPCNLTQVEKCVKIAYASFLKSKLSQQCYYDCPGECRTTLFTTSLARSDFPSLYYAQLLVDKNKLDPNPTRNFTTFDQIKKSVLAVNIYFEDISLVVLQEEPKLKVEQFASSIGGLVGLCIGASFLSIAELAELIFHIVFLVFQNIVSRSSATEPLQNDSHNPKNDLNNRQIDLDKPVSTISYPLNQKKSLIDRRKLANNNKLTQIET